MRPCGLEHYALLQINTMFQSKMFLPSSAMDYVMKSNVLLPLQSSYWPGPVHFLHPAQVDTTGHLPWHLPIYTSHIPMLITSMSQPIASNLMMEVPCSSETMASSYSVKNQQTTALISLECSKFTLYFSKYMTSETNTKTSKLSARSTYLPVTKQNCKYHTVIHME